MKKFIFSLILILFNISFALCENSERIRIAVFDPASSGTSIDEGTKIAVREIISSTIVNTGMYSIVERSLLEKVMQEQKFSNSGAVDDVQATEIGKLAGANKVVLSVVTLAGGRNMLSIKIIDVKTATVERQKVKIVTSGELLDIIEPLTLETLNLPQNTVSTYSTTITPTDIPANEPVQIYQDFVDKTEKIPDTDIIMFGVDFSKVQIYKAEEGAKEFYNAFVGINELLKSEADKYDFSRLVGREVGLYTSPTDKLINEIDWQYAMNSDGVLHKFSVEDMVKRYDLPQTNKVGMVIIAWLLNKYRAIGTYEVVFFDIKTRNIIYNKTVMAESGGVSLRNYWANPIYDIIKTKSLRKELELFL